MLAAPGHASAAVTARAATTATDGQPSKSQRIRILTAVLRKMHKDFKNLLANVPGPADVLDYQIGSLWRQGIDGTGTTVALLEGWTDPVISQFIRAQDKIYGLPDPRITTIFPSGDHKLPATCPPGMVKLGGYGSCDAWAGELELDVLAVHLIAPYARILISVTPADSQVTDDAASQVAPPEMMQAVEFISSHHLADVVSVSDGSSEGSFSHGLQEITAQNPGELSAAAAGIPLLVSTGDCDAAQHRAVGPDGECTARTATKTRATAAWDDSPWVTAVGGTTTNLNDRGQRVGPDPLWNLAPDFPFGEGAGFSAVYARPGYQNRVKSITGSAMRSVPDLTMDAADGTSQAAPLLAGVLALATQVNHGKDVGPINNVLYGVLGPLGTRAGVADVVKGNNTLIRNHKVIVRGFTARKGFDVASGWGTVRADRFVPSLVAATVAAHQDRAVRSRAAAALNRLEHQVRISPADVGAGQSARVRAEGFLPLHPVTVFIDDRMITTVQAGAGGSVSYLLDPAALGLPTGQHVLRLISMLLTAGQSFRSS